MSDCRGEIRVRSAVMAILAFTPCSRASDVDFNRDIRPILSDNCFNCHGGDAVSRKGGLRLDDREAALVGGKSGAAAIVPGKPAESELLLRVRSPHEDEAMPPPDKNGALKPADIAKLEQWIAAGAPYAAHWSFIPPEKRPLPGSDARRSEVANPVDAFVHARLAREQIPPAQRADAAILARRLHLDIAGLPPTPAEVAAFESEFIRDPQSAVRHRMNSLLALDSYGEKWARHWLDVARYSDSNGYEKDHPRQMWAWRDWVIDAINRDLPYDRFIIEQVAGDLLPNATPQQVVATGFLRNSMTNEEGAIVPEQFRTEEMFDRMDALGKGVLGLTLQCAQCHTHKFDPITHDEYFGLFAFLNNTYEAQSPVHPPDQQRQRAQLAKVVEELEHRLKIARPAWPKELADWAEKIRAEQVPWTTLVAKELGSSNGLNHPTQAADGSVFALGHQTTRGSIYLIAEPELKNVTGMRLEALPHRDLPFGGPGRSKYGTWAISEMTVSVRTPGSTVWQPLKLLRATADYSEPAARLEDEWAAEFDKEKKRTRGPVSFLIDGKKDTGWRADRGPGRRHQPSVAVVEFECPADYPPGTKLKVELTFDHGGSDNGIHNTMLGRHRLAFTSAPSPRASAVDYAAVLALAVPEADRSLAERDALFTAWRQSLPEAAAINAEIDAAWAAYPVAPTSVLHLAERAAGDTRATHLLDRGSWDRPKHVVVPHTPAALHPLPANAKVDRLAFARWLVDRRSPLAARVAVNRIWQAVFGTGLVETAEDFGTRAPVPEYLDLLDWLAVDFMEHNWSEKHLLRTILSSATYQQASAVPAALLERDPANKLLARGPRFRLEAEVLRDAALSVAGLLTPGVGGASIYPPVPQSVLDYNYTKPDYWITPTGPERYRRTIYMFRKRSMPDPALGAFDAPNGDTACVRRPRSNTPLAALTGLNETIFVEAAQGLALRILREAGASDAERIDAAYRLVTARAARAVERERLLALLRATRQRLADGWLEARSIATGAGDKLPALPAGTTPQDAAAWTIVARVLLNLDETLTKS